MLILLGGNQKSRKKCGPKMTDVFKAFIEWSVMTSKERDEIKISTAKAFAKKYKLHPSHLSSWKTRDDFLENKKVSYSYNKPFALAVKMKTQNAERPENYSDRPNWLPLLDEFRTLNWRQIYKTSC